MANTSHAIWYHNGKAAWLRHKGKVISRVIRKTNIYGDVTVSIDGGTILLAANAVRGIETIINPHLHKLAGETGYGLLRS